MTFNLESHIKQRAKTRSRKIKVEAQTLCTPGPWHLEDYGWSRKADGDQPVFRGRIAATKIKEETLRAKLFKRNKGYTVLSGAAFGIWGRTAKEAEANALLMTAAPEMLEALKTSVRLMHLASRQPCVESGIELARRAIAKAEGRAT